MSARAVIPILWPILLLGASLIQAGLPEKIAEQRMLSAKLDNDLRRLEMLRAVMVSGRLEKREYESLLKEFAALTSLQSSDPFRDPNAGTMSSIQVASLITSIQEALSSPVEEEDPPRLELISVSPVGQERIGPFVMMEFALNLQGRFRAIPSFLRMTAELARHRKLAISIGELHLDSSEIDPTTGEGLAISLPIRAYFHD